MSSNLYNQDYQLWLTKTAQQLRERQWHEVDWENLIEEIEDMRKSQRRAVESYLTRLLEHLFKLAYWQSEKSHSGNYWASEIVNFRYQIRKRLQESASLKSAMSEIDAETLPVAIKSVSKLFPLPPNADISLEQALDDDWFPDA